MNVITEFIRDRLLSVLVFLLTFFQINTGLASSGIQVYDLKTEYRENPIGIDVTTPRLSWKVKGKGCDVMQSAYEIRAAHSIKGLQTGQPIWTSKKTESDESVHIEYQGPKLQSEQRIYWQVRVWDANKQVSQWSEPAFWEMGLLEVDDWVAQWISKDEAIPDSPTPSHFYRTEFKTTKPVAKARVFVTSLGIYELQINGEKVGDQLFTPGFTSYKNRIQYQVYDVTGKLKKDNAMGAIVGDGWYRGYLGWSGNRNYYGDRLGLLAQLHITYEDGSKEIISTDKDWRTSYGPIIESDIYNGEKYDARKEFENWSSYGFEDGQWLDVQLLDHSKDILVASNSIPVKIVKEITPIKKLTTPKGEVVYDLGQNIVGWARIKVSGKKGDKVTLQFAEVLDKEGNFFTKNLRAAEATDIYTLKGGLEEVFEPHFTFHGFRFIKVQVEGSNPEIKEISGQVIHSQMQPTGQFSCSDPLINQLQSNIQWGQKDNFLDIPTDCPQRDERVGWTGDAQVFSMTAAFNFDVAAFYTKWLKDLALDQQPNGEVPNIIPDMWDNKLGGTTAWGDAAVIVPWTVYRAYGDKRVLEQQYESMKAWVDYMRLKSGDDLLWNEKGKHHWGDWLAFHSDSPAYAGSVTENDLIATAYFKYSTELLGKTARILGKEKDAQTYSRLSEDIKEAFINEFVTANGRLVSHTQTAYALAISFDLVPEHLKENAAQYFADNVKRFKHLTTGFVGTPLLCSTLSSIGRDDLAFMLLNRKEYPSWLYPVTQGATTIWERWDTQKPDGTIIDGMNSFNHYAYGAIGEWLYSHVAGLKIDVEKPGYKHSIFSPHPGGGLTSAMASIESIYGTVVSDWKIEEGKMIYRVVIPANTTGTVKLPKSAGEKIQVTRPSGKSLKLDEDDLNKLGSGEYLISYKYDD
ncbi:glycoside hydrolase family 78 protein [Reichenbachiella ulvae]|uniref:alpha-L-rhamnosidase n=1 Tax=Reichenbachiella ulvae TaxID=2980104 RepID=A0ABT3CSY7_9BACT|nr:glycoside hydrolase family 78 protein [Reichenbachiella ulvae]MCV9386701.1 glycoside hydrolase family 78 protein [Reichenbachiella ulvae]